MRNSRFLGPTGAQVPQMVVYPEVADNCLTPKARYNAPISHRCEGALPWCRTCFSPSLHCSYSCGCSSCFFMPGRVIAPDARIQLPPSRHAANAPTPPQGRYLTALLSPYGLSLSRLARAGQPPCQRPSQWRSLETIPFHRVQRLLSRASWHDLSWEAGGRGADRARAGVFG